MQQFGSSIAAKIVLLRSRCLGIMLSQEDWEWFFGDTSEYVSKVAENTEHILKHAQPENIETSRLTAAGACQSYLFMFTLNRVQKMTMVLQFGFVNVLNSALVLLQDEDEDVREATMDFADSLPR